MKNTLTLIITLFMSFLSVRADTLPAGIDTDNIMVGVTGMTVASKGGDLSITEIAAGTPAEVSLKKGDILLEVDGKSLKIEDFRHTLGFAINKAEGRDGQMKFTIKRNGVDKEVIIKLKPVGSYSKTYPIGCKKSNLDLVVPNISKEAYSH